MIDVFARWEDPRLRHGRRLRLERVRRERGVDLTERLLAIGRNGAAHLKEPFRTIDHEDMLYDDRGLPK
jgi:antitoxin VapB